jgi:hypothetical protein
MATYEAGAKLGLEAVGQNEPARVHGDGHWISSREVQFTVSCRGTSETINYRLSDRQEVQRDQKSGMTAKGPLLPYYGQDCRSANVQSLRNSDNYLCS